MPERARPSASPVVLITGASSGIGAALARLLAPRARVLVLVARRAQRLHALAEELRASRPELVVDVRPCDLTDASATAALAHELLREHGGVDLLVNNAGLGDIGLFEVADLDKLIGMIQVNVIAPTVLTRLLLPGMIQRGAGQVLNISSGFGLVWMPGAAAYEGTKHHVTAWTEALRTELTATGVQVCQVCPGPVRTEFEDVAGNPTGQEVPGFLELSAEECARAAVAALDRGQAMTVPGFWAWLGISAGRSSPRWLLRPIYGLLGRLARRKLPSVPAASSASSPAG